MKSRWIFRTLLIPILFFSAWGAGPAPYSGIPETFRQPDGRTLTFQVEGNLRFVSFKSLDGYTLLKKKAGDTVGYYYAFRDAGGDLARSEILAGDAPYRSAAEIRFLEGLEKDLRYSEKQVAAFAASSLKKMAAPPANAAPTKAWHFPAKGSPNLLVILAKFSDRPNLVSRNSFDSLFNAPNYTANGLIYGGFQKYFSEASYGAFTPKVTVLDWVTVKTHDTYKREAWPFQLDALDAVQKAYPSQDWSKFDNDKDGVIEGVLILHSGPSDQSQADDNIVSITYDHYVYNRKLGAEILACAATTGEVEYPQRFGANEKAMTLGLIVHEFGHMMGLSDLYPYDGSRESIGYTDVMAAGSWGGWGKTPVIHSIFNKQILGWATPSVLSVPAYVTLRNSLENKDAFYRINSATRGDYFLIENRQPVGFDRAFSLNDDGKGHGLILYHVDSTLYAGHNVFTFSSGTPTSGSNDVNTNGHASVKVLPADNAQVGYDPDNALSWPGAGNKTAFTDATTPNMKAWSGTNTSKPITNISEYGQIVGFSFMGAAVGLAGGPETSSSAAAVPRPSLAGRQLCFRNIPALFLGGRLVIRSPTGSIAYEGPIREADLFLPASRFHDGLYLVSLSNGNGSETTSGKFTLTP
jgi:M6 family metalloprotease-like protein